MTPARPRSETSTRRFARGGWAGRSVIARKTRNRLACDRAPQSFARPHQPATTRFAPRFRAPRSRPPPKGAPYCSLCSQTFVNIYFFSLIFRSAQSLHFVSKMTILHIKMSFCRYLLRVRFYTTFVSLLYFAHVERHNVNNNY